MIKIFDLSPTVLRSRNVSGGQAGTTTTVVTSASASAAHSGVFQSEFVQCLANILIINNFYQFFCTSTACIDTQISEEVIVTLKCFLIG